MFPGFHLQTSDPTQEPRTRRPRKNRVVVVMDEIELVKTTKDRDREEIAFDLDLKAVKPCFTLLFQNMDTMRATDLSTSP